jgi:hypothetical protein
MIKVFKLFDTKTGNELSNVPVLQFRLNTQKDIAIIGLNADEHGGFKGKADENHPTDIERFGTLNDLANKEPIIYEKVVEGMELYDWDFENYPCPDIYYLTKKTLLINPN